MTEYKPLTDEKSRFIAEKIYNKNASKTSSHETPTMILVAGQPGAGKTAAANNAKLELRQKGGFIHVDADKVRLEIPGGHTVPSSETQADCQKLVMHLRNFAIVGGRNILEEGTFRGERVFSETAEKMHEKGYNVEVIGVAAHMEQSRFNVQSRREKQREAGEPPRDVPEKYQEDAYRGYTANMVNDTGTLDRVRVVNRAGQMLFDSTDHGNSLYGSVEEALEKGRTLSVEQLAKISQDWTELQQKCEDKRLSPQDMARIHEGRALFEECFKRETD
ncbi:MAG: zeta toxin family protein, partial [Zoogloeaceae bacterium]|nr:zeta toxin family protein [Zoogloeaceae bacterium]